MCNSLISDYTKLSNNCCIRQSNPKSFAMNWRRYCGVLIIIVMIIDSLGIFVVTVDSGGTVGFLIGYFLRKLFKLVLFAIGGVLSFLLYLQYQGLITMNMDKIQSIADKFVTTIPKSISVISQIEDQFNIVPYR